MNDQVEMNSAAIVCGEVATQKTPILYAERSEPEDAADSGWQFMCGAGDEDPQAAQVWALHEVIEQEPSLSSLINSPIGTIISRSSAKSKWEIEHQ